MNMFEAPYVLLDRAGEEDKMQEGVIPRLHDVRRVPVRYHRTLSLLLVKRHQCVVLGTSRSTLTVGITECSNDALLHFLQTLTGAAIFPVLVDSKRMRLLITRIERYQRFQHLYSQAYSVLHMPSQVRLILNFKEGMEGKKRW